MKPGLPSSSANLIVLGTALVILVGGMQVLRGHITIGTLLLALAYLGFVYGRGRRLS